MEVTSGPEGKSLSGKKFVSYAEAEGLTDEDFKRDPEVENRKVPELDEQSELAFIYNIFFYKETAVEHVFPQLLFAWGMCAVANVIYWLLKGYQTTKDDDDDEDDDSLEAKYKPSYSWIPIDVEAMHGIVGTVSIGFCPASFYARLRLTDINTSYDCTTQYIRYWASWLSSGRVSHTVASWRAVRSSAESETTFVSW